MRYIVLKNNKILQILKNKPLFIRPGTELLIYEGNEPNETLEYTDGKIQSNLKKTNRPKLINIEDQQKSAIEQIEKNIDSIRQRVDSLYSTQTSIYREKVQEAIDYIAHNFPDSLSQFPFIELETKLTNETPKEIAFKIISRYKQWLNIAIKTEEIRKKAKQSILTCNTEEQIQQILEQYQRQLDRINAEL